MPVVRHLWPGCHNKSHDSIHTGNPHPGSPPRVFGKTNTIPDHLSDKFSRDHRGAIRHQHPTLAPFQMHGVQNNLSATDQTRPSSSDAYRGIHHRIWHILHMGKPDPTQIRPNLPPGPEQRLDSSSLSDTNPHGTVDREDSKRSMGHTRQGQCPMHHSQDPILPNGIRPTPDTSGHGPTRLGPYTDHPTQDARNTHPFTQQTFLNGLIWKWGDSSGRNRGICLPTKGLSIPKSFYTPVLFRTQ